ncbi:MAG: tRNA (N(6)-L-threonylcarbamoyladenosine(37)-C(2))-methylthiotransferase MtaB [Oscillospiraceae bacterium]|nr:tRNA (N(6)-L-threonylcarbamoyladenosine(37)-C(2))-methylthiotransferase MtaB [Oscillospiraceae bacterium]
MILSFKTLGCKTNQFETGALQTLLTARGHRLAEPDECAELVIVNTCAVTAESCRKSRSAVRKARTEHPGCMVAVCGCLSQLSPEEVAALEADLVAGSGDRIAFVEDLERVTTGQTAQTEIDIARDRETFEILPAGGLEGRTRALLKIEDGCDNFCAYCIVPYARGPVRSMPLDAAVEQASGLAREGYKELVLTGIEISSYGKDQTTGETLIDLIEAICKAVPDLRVRLGSLEPRTVTEAFCERLGSYPNLCPHFHLSLQSGSDEVLNQMGRRYDTARYLESLALLRRTFQDVAVTTDLIVGFPGESEAEFDESLAFLQTCAFASVHVFPYSERTGTKAADLPNQIPKADRTRRAKQAGEMAKALQQNWLRAQIGKTMPVLFETTENGKSQGHTPNYCPVIVSIGGLENQVRTVTICGQSGAQLIGEIVEK